MKKLIVVIFLFFLCGCLKSAPTFDLKTADSEWATFSDEIEYPWGAFYHTLTFNKKYVKGVTVEEDALKIVIRLELEKNDRL